MAARFDGKEIVSAANLAVTKTPRVGLNDRLAYAMGWVLQSTPNGQITWHNGGTTVLRRLHRHRADKDVGVIVLTNLQNVGFPDAVGEWTLDRLLGNADVDHVAAKLATAKAADELASAAFDPVANPAPPPPLASLSGGYANPALGSRRASGRG